MLTDSSLLKLLANRGSVVGVASRLATIIYVAMVMPVLYDNSYSPITQISNMKVIGFMVDF